MINYRTSLFAALAATALLQACSQSSGPDQTKVQGNVAKAQADGQKIVVDAQAKLEQVNAQNNKDMVNTQVDAHADDASKAKAAAAASNDNDVAKARIEANGKVDDARYEVEKAKAEAANNVAQAQCAAQTGAAEKSCKDKAKETYDSAVATAKSRNEAAHQRNTAAPTNG